MDLDRCARAARPAHSGGLPEQRSLELDGPGQYWYGSTTGNDEGRGLTASIVVGGDTPPEARLDRPPQPQP
jgi:PQQ system protein